MVLDIYFFSHLHEVMTEPPFNVSLTSYVNV